MENVHAAYEEHVSRCRACKGLFVPSAAMAQMCREWFLWPRSKSERGIDTGKKATGRTFDAVVDIECPVCHTRMAHVVVEDQEHITLEQCGSCEGIFFDAGELTDTRYRTVADWVRGLVDRKRGGKSAAKMPFSD